jgi:hypothetical protein
MKNQLFFTALLSLCLLHSYPGLSQPSMGRSDRTKVEFVPLDLSVKGIPAIMNVTKGATVADIGGIIISDGEAFSIRAEAMESTGFSLAATKREAEQSELNKLKRYIVSNDSIVLYEVFAGGNRIEYHLHAALSIGGKHYHFYNDRGLSRNSEESAIAMYEAIKGIVRK